MMTIKLGSRGQEVKDLQLSLNNLGYDAGSADGIFGIKTDKALKEYQVFLGVSPSGILGPWVKNKLMPTIIEKKVIVITAGHSNKDPGAVNGKRTEADIVLEMRNIVSRMLTERGYIVLTDGEGTVNNSLREAVKLIPKGFLALEFHLNAAANKLAGGVEALAHSKYKSFCKDLCGGISTILGSKVRGGEGGWKSEDSGQHSRLAYVSNGGIILETFFISNEAELLAYDERKEEICNSIVESIIRFVG